ncbi:hypothetical protein JRQ81_009382 [Phrynocephalus forsythii]|uniref:GON-4-like protein n=1 Tax=Phrynocephalus forsythii TaxID=171643 RepID=A0A9Q1ASG7_9SAUR|nr:hypothetical protein JRQ81_009382 [Phrynocephalus forsythii]
MEARLGLREEVVSSGPGQDKLEPDKATAAGPASPAVRKCPQTLVRRPGFPEEPTAPSGPDLQDKGAHSLPTSMDVKPRGMEAQGVPPKILPAGTGREKPDKASSHLCLSADPKTKEELSLSQRLQGPKPLPQATGGRERTGPLRGEEALPRATEAATVCAKNIKVSSTGEKVVLWTREADRVILTACQDRGANLDTFRAISRQLQNKTAEEVAHRLRELMALFHTACEVSSEDEEDGLSASNTDPEEQEEMGFEV